MDVTPPRTLLEQLVRCSRRSVEEHCALFEQNAAAAGENTSLSTRQLQRWMAGSTTSARPVSQRVAERCWGHPFDTLIGPPADTGTELATPDPTEHPPSPLLDLLGRANPTGLGALTPTPDAITLVRGLQEIDFSELAQVIVMWLTQFNTNIARRDLLMKLSAAFAAAGAAPLFDGVNADEHERIAGVLHDPSRLDSQTLAHYEVIVTNLRRQDNVLGPRSTLQAALAQRHLMSGLSAAAPPALKARALSISAELSQLVGWLLFGLGDYSSALYYYDEARERAHEAQNAELVTYVLCTMSQLQTWRGKPRVGIDHAVAAATWAQQANSPHALAYAADVAVRAYLAEGQHANSERALADEYTAMRQINADTAAAWWYFYDESFWWNTRAQVEVRRGNGQGAMEAITHSLRLVEPTNLHELCFRRLFEADAHVLLGEVDEASRIVGAVVDMSAVNSTRRISQRVTAVRTSLTPWQDLQAVRELDDRIAAHHLK